MTGVQPLMVRKRGAESGLFAALEASSFRSPTLYPAELWAHAPEGRKSSTGPAPALTPRPKSPTHPCGLGDASDCVSDVSPGFPQPAILKPWDGSAPMSVPPSKSNEQDVPGFPPRDNAARIDSSAPARSTRSASIQTGSQSCDGRSRLHHTRHIQPTVVPGSGAAPRRRPSRPHPYPTQERAIGRRTTSAGVPQLARPSEGQEPASPELQGRRWDTRPGAPTMPYPGRGLLQPETAGDRAPDPVQHRRGFALVHAGVVPAGRDRGLRPGRAPLRSSAFRTPSGEDADLLSSGARRGFPRGAAGPRRPRSRLRSGQAAPGATDRPGAVTPMLIDPGLREVPA